MNPHNRLLPFFCFFLVALGLAGCGGGGSTGGGNALTFPDSSQTPEPVAVPPDYDTAEYRENYGLGAMNAITAYEAGLSGAGVTVAVIDTGVDLDHPELDSAILATSTNIVTGQASDAEDADTTHGHGTAVAGIIAAERNDAGTHGVAFDSGLLAIGAVDPALCTEDDCSFSQSDLARALDYARSQGARVVNFSLGGAAPGSTLVTAMQSAVEAGMVIIISAGNESEAAPSDFASVAGADWANGQIVIAGASDSTDAIADFSNRAGDSLKDVFVLAPGVFVTTTNAGGGFKLVSGTSFSAPHVAGAMALLLEQFPNLTASEVTEILLTSARDLGDPGVDAVHGQGIIDLAAALAPAGPVGIAVSSTAQTDNTGALTLEASGLDLSPAFGDALGDVAGFESAMGLDRYGRSYRVNLGNRTIHARSTPDLTAIVDRRSLESHETRMDSALQLFGRNQGLNIRTTVRRDRAEAEWAARYMAGRGLAYSTRPDMDASLTLDLGAGTSLHAAHGYLAGMAPGAGLLLENTGVDIGHALAPHGTRIGISRALSTGVIWRTGFMTTGSAPSLVDNESASTTGIVSAMTIGQTGGLRFGVRMSAFDERNAVLGSRSAGALSLGDGARTLAGGIELAWNTDIAAFYLDGSVGRTRVAATEQSLVKDIAGLWSSSWRAGIRGQGILVRGDSLGFEISQPLRVEGGAALIHRVTGRDYEADRLLTSEDATRLSPSGREIRLQAGYALSLTPAATLHVQVMHQIDAGHRDGFNASTVLMGLSRPF